MSLSALVQRIPLLGTLLGHRFVKFGFVGASGIPVNLAVLFVAREYLFAWVTLDSVRLNLALAVAILVSTANNFFWNRRWTWADRRAHHEHKHALVQFGQYALACWIGIALQFIFTNLLNLLGLHYLMANFLAIALASVFNYVVNDRWTFSRWKKVASEGPSE